jgi:hypothetical protein
MISLIIVPFLTGQVLYTAEQKGENAYYKEPDSAAL